MITRRGLLGTGLAAAGLGVARSTDLNLMLPKTCIAWQRDEIVEGLLFKAAVATAAYKDEKKTLSWSATGTVIQAFQHRFLVLSHHQTVFSESNSSPELIGKSRLPTFTNDYPYIRFHPDMTTRSSNLFARPILAGIYDCSGPVYPAYQYTDDLMIAHISSRLDLSEFDIEPIDISNFIQHNTIASQRGVALMLGFPLGNKKHVASYASYLDETHTHGGIKSYPLSSFNDQFPLLEAQRGGFSGSFQVALTETGHFHPLGVFVAGEDNTLNSQCFNDMTPSCYSVPWLVVKQAILQAINKLEHLPDPYIRRASYEQVCSSDGHTLSHMTGRSPSDER